jgi:prolyl oligopeptidase
MKSLLLKPFCLGGVALIAALVLSPLSLAEEKVNGVNESGKKVSDVTAEEDPHLALEDVTGEGALDWVRARNAKTQAMFDAAPEFIQLKEDLLKILDSDDRIPFVTKRGEYYYNFWRDKKNVRGLWRRTTLEEYRKSSPAWEVLLDLDELAARENENWVWSGASLLRPAYDRALISLSRGGADANVVREFDIPSKSFVPGGFEMPEAKGVMGWIDRDSVFVATDFGDGSKTSSGYPRIAKLWKRGVPMSEAKTIYEGEFEDMYISATHDDSPGYERNFLSRTIAFYNDELYLIGDDLGLTKVEAPNTANKSVFHDYLLLELRDPWEVGGKSYAAGSLLVTRFDDFMAGKRDFDVAFAPTETTSLAGYTPTKNHLLINILDNVKNRIEVLSKAGDGWRREPLVGAPELGTITVSAVDADESDEYFMTVSGYVTPTTLSLGRVGERPEELKRLPDQFDARGLNVTQHFVASQDGTKVPYFMIAREGLRFDGENPTLLYGYGGFEISLTPGYNPTVGRGWLESGGVYVVANIRGGGEYGPRWHQAALKQNRLRAYEDFAAVGQDLIDRRVTSVKRLGIQGGSNGGLLVGNMVTLYPQLFSAAVCQVPLLDMKRFHLLLAGASWMAEYGNPDAPGEWDFIKTYSPYQNLKTEGVRYPSVLFTTSTRDDRVHPGHARKMMAKMEAAGMDVLYYENIEGGHGGAANNQQRAYMTALAYQYLKSKLFDKPAK